MSSKTSAKVVAMNRNVPGVLLIFGIVMVACATMIVPPSAAQSEEQTAPITDREKLAQQQQEKKHRLREGAEIVDAKGTFEWIGDRLSFIPDDDGVVVKILENRMMERVVQSQETSTGELVWMVSGVVTEYRGSNYLLMKHVVLSGKRGE